MAELTVQTVARTGLNPVYTAATAAGDEANNNGRMFIHVVNGGGSPITVTVDDPYGCDLGTLHDEVITVNNASDKLIGPFNPKRFNDADGHVNWIYSDDTTVTVAAIKIM